MTLAILLVVSYFVGAIPFGVIVTRAHGINIFEVGSKSTGATNVSRALGKGWALTVFALDVLKGVAPTLAARVLIREPMAGLDPQGIWFVCGLGAVLGHCLSVFIGFRGGKGIATALGVGLAATPEIALCAFGIFLVAFAVCRYISLSSMVAVCSAVVLGLVIPGQSRAVVVLYGLVAVFVIYRHRANIGRLRNGSEPKFDFKKKLPSGTSDDKPSAGEHNGDDADESK
jgi:glycerol-3-phosphate acyltransferase PlsY